MNIKTLIIASAIALAPFAATASTFMPDGSTQSISGGDQFNGVVVAEEIAEGLDFWSVLFNSTVDPLDANAVATIELNTQDAFEDPTLWWISASDWNGEADTLEAAAGSALASSPIGLVETTLETTFQSPDDLSQYLVVTWTATTGGGFDVEVSAVPVPAGILLMGTALAGFGVMRRKAKKAA